ncbi:MAG: hypothetical protein P8X89_10905 [Reinekea sp.]
MLPKNWGEPMGAPAIFEKQIEITLSEGPYRHQKITQPEGCVF